MLQHVTVTMFRTPHMEKPNHSKKLLLSLPHAFSMALDLQILETMLLVPWIISQL